VLLPAFGSGALALLETLVYERPFDGAYRPGRIGLSRAIGMIRSVFEGYSANWWVFGHVPVPERVAVGAFRDRRPGLEGLAVGFDGHVRVRDQVREPRWILGLTAFDPTTT